MKESRYRQSGRSQRNGMEATSWHIWLVVERRRREPQPERENQRNCGLPIADCEIGGGGGGRSLVASLLRMTGIEGWMTGLGGGSEVERRAQRAAPTMKRR